MARRIAITGFKGGSGRSTVAANLASVLASRGHKTLLVDMDPQAQAGRCLGVEKEGQVGTYELLLGLETNAAKVALPTAVSGLHLIPSSLRLCGAEQELASIPRRAHRLGQALSRLEEGYFFVLVDCPAYFGLLTLNALAACHEAWTPVAGAMDARSLEDFSRITAAVAEELGSCATLTGIVPNMWEKKTPGLSTGALEKKYGKRLIRSKIRMDAKLREAAAAGKPVNLFAPESGAAFDFEALADDLMAL